ncbi:preprotein translocase subunit YajC [Streptomyces carpaticus]|uniref:Preprotein translocase subunit YajC n=2 Tax=Streptomyces TaxID=1883 RepID=A0A1I6QWH8_9ACTN|nr:MULTISPECIES: preprotein translocase subunit YajC [Streptomyces]MCK1813077.1 preprotein translocase subunit YajC [Streptomyces sp. XM4011]UWM48066.1 preprotein translocase subunit YajC [Streptomyces carpaticus]SFS56857.1 preprotein translocase subunit YajC [Streptomyces harbinensis]
MDIAFLFPFILLIGVMFMMSRSAKNRQRQAMEMRDAMEPGTGVRTIGGMYAEVKEVREDTVLLELSPGVHALFAKNAIGAVLDADEYERIINGESPYDDEDAPVVPDDASSLTEGTDTGDDRVELGKKDSAEATAEDETKSEDSARDGENGSKS